MTWLLKRTTFPKCTIALQNNKLCVRVLLILLKTCIEIFKTFKGFNAPCPHYLIQVHITERYRSKMVTTTDGNLHSVKVSRYPKHSAWLQTVYSRDNLFVSYGVKLLAIEAANK